MLGALWLLIAGCGAYIFPGDHPSPTANTGMVSGRVLVVPCAPVEQAGSPCGGKPAGGLEIDYVQGTKVVGRTVTDPNGKYSIRLEPGAYTVKFTSYMRVISGPTKIAVSAGSSLVADYMLDSGIRVPAQG
ncbi:MAG TPA: hypothetical protein VJX71_05155 [Methylomirabilota bacterium]|nr:hypothetical protein [Methylomirabilota bacterium]